MLETTTSTYARTEQSKGRLTPLQRAAAVAAVMAIGLGGCGGRNKQPESEWSPSERVVHVREVLGALAIKGRAPKTGYDREEFMKGWKKINGCDMRNRTLRRDMEPEELGRDKCTVLSGVLDDKYTSKHITFRFGKETSDDVQVDHVVSLGDAWQKGAQQLSPADRTALAYDSLNLQAVDGPTNGKKSDADAASWLPPNDNYHCSYIGRQILVKERYHLWVTQAEHDTMAEVMTQCQDVELPAVA